MGVEPTEWEDYEELIAFIANNAQSFYSTIDVRCRNQANDKKLIYNRVLGKSKYDHQIDVSIHLPDKLFIVECKYWNKKVGVAEILVLASRLGDIKAANPQQKVEAVIASKLGLTKGATQLAEYFEIKYDVVKSKSEFCLQLGRLISIGIENKMVIGSFAEAEIARNTQ